MNSFFRDVISKLINAEFQGHTSFKVADNKAVGDNPIRELHLDAVPVNDDKSIVSLAFDGGNKLFEKTLSSEEARHTFDLISSDMSEAVSLTSSGKYDEAKKIMESLVNKYSETSGEVVPTNLPPVTTTQASEDSNIWKQAKVSLRNIFPSGTIQDLNFDTQEELSAYQEQMQKLSPQDRLPLWDMNKSKVPEGEESTELAAPSLSYDQIEKEKEKEHKNLEKSIDEKIKTEVESALIEKAATVFGPDQVELVKVLRKNGRNWDEIKKILVKDFNFDKEATTIFVDDLRSKEEGTPAEEVMPEAPKPPEHLVSPETHDDLLKDLDTEKKSEPPVKEEKEPTFTPKDIMDIPEEKESSKKCPKCGEDVWDVSTVDQRLNKCWNCGTRFDNPEVESSLSNEIARADNAEIRKVAFWKDNIQNVYSNYEEFLSYDRMYYLHERLGYESAEDLWQTNPVVQGSTNPDEYKVASLNKKALNPLQEPPVVEQPTAETSNQDIVPISQTPDHENIQKGDRVFVMSDLGEEKAGFEGTYVSDYTSKGNKYAIIETDEKDLLDVEMHRVSKVSEGTSPEPISAPELQKPEEPEIAVTPKLEDLHSSLKKADIEEQQERKPYMVPCPIEGCNFKGTSEQHINRHVEEKHKEASLESIKAEVKNLEAQFENFGKTAFFFPKDGIKKEARQSDSAFEGNGWVRIWVDQDDVEFDSNYKEALKLLDENSRIEALKEIAKNIAYNNLHDGVENASLYADFNFESLVPSEHDRIDWVALANPEPEEVESSLKQSNVMDTKCEDCGKPLGPEVFLSNHPICGECTRKKHKKVTGGEKCECGHSHSGDVCDDCDCRIHHVAKLDKQAADPEPVKTEYKELKKAPDYIDPKSAVPVSPDMEQVLVKMESLQSKLSVLDQAKEKIKMAMEQELQKIDVGGERASLQKELQDSYEKLGILIDATESKVINWGDKLYTLQHQEKEVVPQPTTKELLAKIYAKFEGAERYVESVLNGFKALAKKVQTKRLVQWPKRSSLEQPMEKEASVMDDLNLLNDEMLKALQALA